MTRLRAARTPPLSSPKYARSKGTVIVMASLRSLVCAMVRVDGRRLSQLRRVGVETSLNQEHRHNFCPAPRHYHGSPLSLSRKQLATLEGAHEFLSSLSPAQRSNLNSALEKIHSIPDRGVWCVKHAHTYTEHSVTRFSV